MASLTWGNGIVLTTKYYGQFKIIYKTSTNKEAWRLYYESYKGSKIIYELFEGTMDEVIDKGMSLFNGVEAKTATLFGIDGKVVI